MTQGKAAGRKRWVGKLALGIIGLAVLGLGVSALMFSRWSEIHEVSAEEADQAFTEILADLGDPPAYLEVLSGGEVLVRRELEGSEPVALEALHLLAWDPDAGRMLRVAFPFWFIRVKMTDSINLGTLTSALAGDWRNLDLSVSEQDLQRLGTGLVLDQRSDDGARILLWTQAALSGSSS